MNNRMVAIVVGLILLISLLLFSMTYSVRFNEVVILTTFGEATAESVQSEPGLHFKWPAPIQSAKKFDSRLQTLDTRLETHATKDGLQVIAQAFVFWRIDPDRVLEFDAAYGGVSDASKDIETRMRSAAGAISEFEFEELIGAENKLTDVEQRIKDRLNASGGDDRSLAQLGVQIEQVGLPQIILPVDTARKVVERMNKEMDEAAELIRGAGEAEALAIKSDGAREAQAILGHAGRVAARIRGQGDTLAADAIASMSIDEEFATFLIWLDALEKSTKGASTFFIPVNFAPFHLLDFQNTSVGGVPQPEHSLPFVPRNRNASDALRLNEAERIDARIASDGTDDSE